MKNVFITLLLFTLPGLQNSAQVSFKASANRVVEVGENFRLNFTANADCSDFTPPSLNDFNVLAGPSQSTSSSFQYINGRTSQAIAVTFTYIVQAKREGKFTIGKGHVSVDGKVYYSDPIVVEAIKGAVANNPNPNTNTETDNQSNAEINNSDLYISVNLNKTTVYQGEHLIATMKVYDRVGLKRINDIKFPSFTGFWSEDVMKIEEINLERENVNGKIYQTAVLKQSILFPQQSGKINIDPFSMEAIVSQKVGRRRNFFDEMVDVYNDVVKKIKSNPRTITVLPLPENKPASFTGAVGSNFTFNVKVDKTELKSNESLTVKVTVSGNGNLKIIDKINVNFPNTFEVYDPKINNNITNTSEGAKGTNTYEYLVIPREPGDYTIPGIQFSYFDVNSKTYKTLSSNNIHLKVGKGDNNQALITNTGLSKEEVQAIGTDIRYIMENDFVLQNKNYTFFGSLGFVLCYLISLLIFVSLIFFLRSKIKQNQNIALLKNRKANKISRKRLKEAEKYMKQGNKEAFYTEVIKALWGYLGDKLNIPLADLSRDTARETMLNQHIDSKIVDDFIDAINNCEFAKYAPVSENNQISHDYEKARNIINKLVEVLS